MTVDHATADGSAVAPGDYTAATGTVTFAPGDTSETVTVQTIDDTDDEGPETFDVNLSNPTGATIADGTGVGTINVNDEPLPVVDAAGEVIVNGPVGPSTRKTSKSFVFKVSNDGTTPITITAADITTSVTVDGATTGTVDGCRPARDARPGFLQAAEGRLGTTPRARSQRATAIAFTACVNLAGDVDPTNDCDTATVTAK